ncbi:MAG: prepilin-type N-terminal cleavage/methylation domain-containing protein [Patescibacteria group bacterium]
MIKKSKNNFKKGFTMIEMIIALSVFSIGIIGVFSLISVTASSLDNISNQLIASYLAQEGMEIVRNIRDSNFLKINQGEAINWDDGLLSHTDSGLGADGLFDRTIEITEVSSDVRKVCVTVSWTEKGRIYEVKAEENIFNWY